MSGMAKSPKQRIAGYVLFLAVYGLALMFLFGTGSEEYERTKACTAVTMGTVQTVRERYHTGRSGGYTWEAEVVPDEEGIFTVPVLHSGVSAWHEYSEGERVKIFYDPADSANRYIEHARPGDSFKLGIYLFLPALTVCGLITARAVRSGGEM